MSLISAQYNFGQDELVHLWPQEDFGPNSIVVVQYGQEAIFVRDGVVIGEPLIEGRHVLTTEILEELRREERTIYGDSTFHAKLYFVNKDRDLSLTWGTTSPFTFRDAQSKFGVKAGARGGYSLGIDDSTLLLQKTIGQMSVKNNYTSFTKFQLQSFIKEKLQEILVSRIATSIREMNLEVIGIEGYYKTISDKVRQDIEDEGMFEAYGFKLRNFSIQAINIDEKDYEKVMHYTNDALQRKQDIEFDLSIGKNYQSETQREVLTRAASNEASGQGMNLGLGLAYAQTVGSAIGGMMGNMGQQQAPVQGNQQAISGISKKCPKCGAVVPNESAFCPSCGNRFEEAGLTCPKCGGKVPAGSKFCPSCGNPMAAAQPQAAFCPNCGKKIEGDSAFCPSCGAKLR